MGFAIFFFNRQCRLIEMCICFIFAITDRYYTNNKFWLLYFNIECGILFLFWLRSEVSIIEISCVSRLGHDKIKHLWNWCDCVCLSSIYTHQMTSCGHCTHDFWVAKVLISIEYSYDELFQACFSVGSKISRVFLKRKIQNIPLYDKLYVFTNYYIRYGIFCRRYFF